MSLLNDFIICESLKGLQPETIETKRKYVERFLAFRTKDILQITSEDVSRYLDSLALSPEKVNLHHTHIRQFYDFLIDQGTCIVNPTRGISRRKERRKNLPVTLTEREVKDIFIASVSRHIRTKYKPIMKRDRAILELLYSSGLRMCEVISLNIDDIDIAHGEINIYHAKGDRERIVPLCSSAQEALETYLQERPKLLKRNEAEALFLSKLGRRISRTSFMRIIYRRKAEAGITRQGATHLFRRSCASHLLKYGAPLPAIRKLLGHESTDTTERYIGVSDTDLQDIFNESHPQARR